MPLSQLCQLAWIGMRRSMSAGWHALCDLPKIPSSMRLKRLFLLLLILPVFLSWQLACWICLLLDELFFPGYRTLRIQAPLCVMGPPRSGTTHLHRVLAEDRERFSTCSAFELMLAPSVLQKKLCVWVAAVDARVGSPLRKAIIWIEEHLLGGLDATHPSSLFDAEEDFYFLIPLQRCFALSILLPRWQSLYDMMTEYSYRQDRLQALDFYKLCLQKHLYVMGPEKTLLSKNASFAAWLPEFMECFPDARLLICERPPSKTVASMISLAQANRVAAAAGGDDEHYFKQLREVMAAHYQGLANTLPSLPPESWWPMPQEQLKTNLQHSVEQAYRHFGLEMTESYQQGLQERSGSSKQFKSRHQYAAEDFGLNPAELDQSFPCIPTHPGL